MIGALRGNFRSARSTAAADAAGNVDGGATAGEAPGVDEDMVVTRLREIESRFACGGAPSTVASCRARLVQWRQQESDIEYQCTVSGAALQRVFGGVCLRYGLVPYRRSRRGSTICVRAPKGFVREVLWPQFEAMADVVEQALGEATERIMETWSGVSFDALDTDVPSG